MISISPNSHLRSNAKHVIRRNFIFADTGIEKFCIQFDDVMLFRPFRSRSWQLQALEGDATQEDGHGDVALQPGPAASRNPADDNSHDQGGRKDQSRSPDYKRGPTRARPVPAYRNHRYKDTKRGEAPSRDAEPAGNYCQEEDNRHGDDL